MSAQTCISIWGTLNVDTAATASCPLDHNQTALQVPAGWFNMLHTTSQQKVQWHRPAAQASSRCLPGNRTAKHDASCCDLNSHNITRTAHVVQSKLADFTQVCEQPIAHMEPIRKQHSHKQCKSHVLPCHTCMGIKNELPQSRSSWPQQW